MEGEFFYSDKIEFIFGEYFKEFSEKNTALFISKDAEKKLNELFENKMIYQEFTRFLVRKICLMVFSGAESERLRELFDSKMN